MLSNFIPLSQLNVNDVVTLFRTSNYSPRPRRVKVLRITKTTYVTEAGTFKRDGQEYNKPNSRLYIRNESQADFDRRDAEYTDAEARKDLTRKLNDFDYRTLPTDRLREIEAILDAAAADKAAAALEVAV